MDKSFFMENRTSLINRIDGDSILILFSGSPIHRSADGNYPFLVNRNFYYLTGLEAVSYTHLDVYKRQVLDMVVNFEKATGKKVDYTIAVSYTHLDVYKRQGQKISLYPRRYLR